MFLTYKMTHQTQQTQSNLFDQIYNNQIPAQPCVAPSVEFCTIKTDRILPTPFTTYQIELLNAKLPIFATQARAFLKKDLTKEYISFKIPKHNGKMRQIDAPNPELKTFETAIKNFLQNELGIIPHNAAYAYVKNRDTIAALNKHIKNKSRWFMKLDLKNFFPSCNLDFIIQQLKQIHPFSTLIQNTPEAEKNLQDIIQAILLREGLPQGSPCSPYITNIIMIPIDYNIHNFCKQYKKQHFCYTRYADDILISSKYEFSVSELEQEINKIITANSPLKINKEKTRYGSINGANWNLGIMLNKENKLSLGYRQKRLIKQKLLNICTNLDNWEPADIRSFLGELSYFKHIEPEYANYLIQHYSEKFCAPNNILDLMKTKI